MLNEMDLPNITLKNGLDLRNLQTTGSVLQIDDVYDESYTPEPKNFQVVDYLGEPVKSFDSLEKTLVAIDQNGFVKKRILEEGGGFLLHEGCTVSIAFSGYWENNTEPFDVTLNKPLVVDLKDSGLLPGLQMAVKSMLVGEVSVFLLSYKVMFGELGIPPRIKAKADCVFYIKLVKSILTPKDGKINFSEPNMFGRVHREVKLLYSSGLTLFKSTNFSMAIHLFRKAVSMLQKCRLADEDEESVQEKLLIKLYINLAICYNKIKLPLKACTACNELNRLNSLWNNGKALFQNAKALRMIGQFGPAEKRLKRAMTLCPDSEDMKLELDLIQNICNTCNQDKLFVETLGGPGKDLACYEFKQEVDNLIKNFKENVNLCKLTLPSGLNSVEMGYVKEACIRENLFFNKIPNNYALDKEEEKIPNGGKYADNNYVLDKEVDQEYNDVKSEDSEEIKTVETNATVPIYSGSSV